jgi:hypothetical protein
VRAPFPYCRGLIAAINCNWVIVPGGFNFFCRDERVPLSRVLIYWPVACCQCFASLDVCLRFCEFTVIVLQTLYSSAEGHSLI